MPEKNVVFSQKKRIEGDRRLCFAVRYNRETGEIPVRDRRRNGRVSAFFDVTVDSHGKTKPKCGRLSRKTCLLFHTAGRGRNHGADGPNASVMDPGAQAP